MSIAVPVIIVALLSAQLYGSYSGSPDYKFEQNDKSEQADENSSAKDKPKDADKSSSEKNKTGKADRSSGDRIKR